MSQIGSSPGFEDGEFENANLMRPAASFYDVSEDCLYFVDSEVCFNCFLFLNLISAIGYRHSSLDANECLKSLDMVLLCLFTSSASFCQFVWLINYFLYLSQNHAIRRADMERRVVETIFPVTDGSKKNKGLWKWILDKIWMKRNTKLESEEFNAESFVFPWHILKSSNNDIYILNQR